MIEAKKVTEGQREDRNSSAEMKMFLLLRRLSYGDFSLVFLSCLKTLNFFVTNTELDFFMAK